MEVGQYLAASAVLVQVRPSEANCSPVAQEHTGSSPACVGLGQTADASQPPFLTVHFLTKRNVKAIKHLVVSYEDNKQTEE